VLVMKYLYRFREPEPWDVIVFKNPQDNRQNYIKRLVALPGETVEIVHGDVFVRAGEDEPFRIRRKERPHVQESMWQVVFDNDYQPNPQLFYQANAARLEDYRIAYPYWQPDGPHKSRWSTKTALRRRFAYTAGGEGWAELTFHGTDDSFLPRYGYNSRALMHREVERNRDVLSDLKLAAVYVPKTPDSRLRLQLSSFEHTFRAEVSPGGQVSLWYRSRDGGDWIEWGRADVPPLEPGRGCDVAVTHVDLRVGLWIDGECVLHSADRASMEPGDDPRRYYPFDYALLKKRLAEAGDRPIPTPEVQFAAAGGPCELWHVRLLRDVHYTSPILRDDPPYGPAGEFARALGVSKGDAGWGATGHPITLWEFPDAPDLDQYFVLGDNSPSSLDGRLWTSAAPTLRLYDSGGELGDPLLGIADVQWDRFAARVLDQADADSPSPGRQVWSLWREGLRSRLKDVATAGPSEDRDTYNRKRTVLRELNRILSAPGFYSPEAWKQHALPPRAQPLARRLGEGKTLSTAQVRQLNRLALEAAFGPEIIARRRVYQLGTVPRYSLIGRAIFVYWPSGFRMPGVERLPIIPNVGRMRLIR
jgi:signal peptidase I